MTIPAAAPVVAGYRLETRLGQGGMGAVYRAVGPAGERVALKILHAHVTSETSARRFGREQAMRIEHPNVVRTLGAGVTEDGRPFVAFELLEGESLEQRLLRERLSPEEATDVGVQACRGLTAIHAAGFVHRDIKPGNLFWCSDGTVKVLDLGVARDAMASTTLTTTGAVVGTPLYLSPEQARGQGDVDARSDVWALGVVLYEALAGRTPFGRDSALATMLAIVTEEAPRLSLLAPWVPRALASDVDRCLEKDRAHRWSSTERLGEALARADLASPSAVVPVSIAPSRANEQRLAVVVLAEGVSDALGVERAVREQGGLHVPLLGHRAVALFGAETWTGAELVRAASAALAIRRLASRVSLASGRAMHDEGNVAGDALRDAERGCARELAGIAVDPRSARELARSFRVVDAGDVLELRPDDLASSPMRSSIPARLPLIARDAELGQIRRGVETALSSRRPWVLLLTGAPGIGKSRLLDAVRDELSVLRAPFEVLVARADPVGTRSAYALLARALRRQLARAGSRLRQRAVATSARPEDTYLAIAHTLDGGSEGQAAVLADLLGEPAAESPALVAARTDPRLMTDRTRLALLDYLEALSRRSTLVFVLEDLQWADPASLELIDDLIGRSEERALLVLGTSRVEPSELGADGFLGRDVMHVRPRPLTRVEVDRLAYVVAGRPLPPEVVTALAARTEGNPLYVEQTVLALRDEGRLGEVTADLPLPVSVEAAVQARLDLLAPAEKEACRRIAVLRRPVTAQDLEALDVPDAARTLGALARREILVRAGDDGGVDVRRYTFRNALVGEIAYRSLTPDQRLSLHATAARHLERTTFGASEEIAFHHDAAGEPEIAARHFADAALTASARGDGRSVLRNVACALERGVARTRLFALHLARAEAAAFLGQREMQGDALDAALAAAMTDAQRARALAERAAWAARVGRPDEILPLLDGALAAAQACGDEETIARTVARRAVELASLGRVDDADTTLETLPELSSRVGLLTRGFVQDARGFVAAARGDHGARRDAFSSARDLYAEAGDLRRAAGAETNLADALNRVGAYADAIVALRAARDKARRLGNRLTEAYALANVAYAESRLGHPGAALEALDEAERVAPSAPGTHLRLALALYRGWAHLAQGEHTEAARLAREVADAAEDSGTAGLRVGAFVLAARAGLAAGDVEGALAASADALALRDRLGSVEEDEAEVYVVRAAALGAGARYDEATAVRVAGRARVLEMAGRITDPAWRQRFLADVDAHRFLVGGTV
ncbi:MAG: protein kinase [Deltaproteobacteria bacterium]|nr:protein kinase [Deltaproteobacteria bacterium]